MKKKTSHLDPLWLVRARLALATNYGLDYPQKAADLKAIEREDRLRQMKIGLADLAALAA